MNVNLTSFQSVFNNYNVYQLVLRPIILTVAAVALAIFTVALVSSCRSRRRTPPPQTTATQPRYNQTRTTTAPPTPYNQTRTTTTTTTPYNQTRTTTTTPTPYNQTRTTTTTPTPYNQTRTPTPSNNPTSSTPSSTSRSPTQSPLPTQPKQTASPPPEQYEGGTYEVSTTHDDIAKEYPLPILLLLVEEIKRRGIGMLMHVEFIGEPGHDGGGLSRQYFTEIFKTMLNITEFNRDVFKTSDIFKLQETKNKMKFLVPQDEPTDDPTVSLFYGIGAAMAYVYFNDEISTGTVFHRAFFDAILCLSDAEIELPFDELSVETKIKMCGVLMKVQHELGGDNFKSYLPLFAFLEKGDRFTEADLTIEIGALYAMEKMKIEEDTNGPRDRFLNTEILDGEYDPRLNIEAILQDRMGFLRSFRDTVLDPVLTQILRLDTESLGKIELTLSPIHLMAKGMKDAAGTANVVVGGRTVKGTRWPEIRSLSQSATATTQVTGSQILMNKIQGVLDPQLMIASIELRDIDQDNQIAVNCTEWTKTWITKNADNFTKLEQLLMFWTGSTTLGVGATLHIQTIGNSPLPKSATCFNRMYVYEEPWGTAGDKQFRNDTEEGFHEMLDEVTNPKVSEEFHRA